MEHKCHVSTRTIQYYDKQGILSPNYTTETNRGFYTDKEVEKLELILLLKEIGCTIKEIKVLLKDDSSMKSLYTFLQIKKHEIQQSITDKENKVCKIEQIQRYVHQNSISTIHYLQDIAIYMEESHRLKGVRKKLWLSIALIGSLQYAGLITSIVTQRKKPFLSMMPVVAMYSLWLTK
ncbi:MerR family transcriptional regulator, partial [Staphylococcus hominis]|uniref:MerR family transcriptional regulator n=1 Tax=Staphylococcus hominis TaxID=1290 RepID=UPI001F0FD2F1